MRLTPYTPEWYQWGANESARRVAELRNVKSQDDLVRMQDAARLRRAAVGLSDGQTITAMAEAKRVGARGRQL